MKNYKKLLLIPIISAFLITCSTVDVQAGTITSKPSTSTTSKPSTGGTGFKSGSYSKSGDTKSTTTKTETKSTKTETKTTTKKSIDTNSKALSKIPTTYSSKSVSNNYYYNVDSGGSSFWSNYWMYRALTPEHRTYVVDGGSNVVAPAYGGAKSIVADVTTLIVVLSLIGLIWYWIRKNN